MRNLRLRSGREANVLPIALMALAIVGFLVIVSWAVTPGLKWPWSADTTDSSTIATTNENANTVAANGNTNTVITNGTTNTAAANVNLPNTAPPVNTNTEPVDEDCSYEPPLGWLTYTDAAIGYRINYPPDWTVSEINNPPDEMFTQPVKYITLTKGSYFLAVGVRHTNDTFLTSDRTGVGAGEFQTAGSEMICDTSVSASQLVFENKAKEWFYSPNGPGAVTLNGHKVNAALSFSGVGAGYTNLDMTNSAELGLARQMMKTLFFIN